MERVRHPNQQHPPIHPLRRIEQMSPDEARVVADKMFIHLTRLDARTTSPSILLPQEKIEAVRLIEIDGLTNGQVAKKLGIGISAIKRAKRDVRACYRYLYDPGPQTTANPAELEVINKLKKHETESTRVCSILDQPQTKEAFVDLPHAFDLLLYYSRFLTISPLLRTVGIRPSLGRNMEYYSGTIRRYLYGNGNTSIKDLSQRYLFGFWFMTGKNWFNQDITEILLETIKQIFSPTNGQQLNDFIYRLRWFFTEILFLEFKQTIMAKSYKDTDLLLMFPTRNDKVAESFDEIDLEKSWEYFAEAGFIPRSFLLVIQKMVKGETAIEIARSLGIGQFYSPKTIFHRFSSVATFLENILLSEVKGSSNQQLLRLTKRRKNLYQIAQKTIRAVDKELQLAAVSPIQEV